MTESEQGIVIGVFEDRKAVIQAIDTLIKAGFHEEQLGFAVRSHEEHIQQLNKQARTPNSVIRGAVGGLLGVADMLLMPITGPSDAAGILATVLPVTEEAIDRLPYPGSHKSEKQAAESTSSTTTPVQPQPLPEQEQAHTEIITQGTPISTTNTAKTRWGGTSSEHTGLITGGVIGGVLGAAAALLLPGIGPIVAGGVLAEVFGALAIGSVAGGFLGAFTNMGVPEEQARHYEQEIKAGRTILAVHTADRQQEIIDILLQNGAHDVQAHG